MPTFQGRAKLERTLPVTLAAMGADDELIICVDGSTDGSVEYVQGIAERDRRVRLVVLATNSGRTVAVNSACTVACGEIVVRLDDDIVVPVGFFDAHANAHHDVGASVGVVQRIRDIYVRPPDRMWAAFVARNSSADAARFRTRTTGRPACMWGAVCSVRREVGESLGWYDEAFSAYGWEDVEFGYRLLASGAEIVELDGVSVDHLAEVFSFQSKLGRGFQAGARMGVFAQIHGPLAVLDALGFDPGERQRPTHEAGSLQRASSVGGGVRVALSTVARSGERLLALLGWRRGYDGWVARWLTWSYACGWMDESRMAGLPLIAPPTAWVGGPRRSFDENWTSLLAVTQGMEERLLATAVLRSAMLRYLERGSLPGVAAARHALGACISLWRTCVGRRTNVSATRRDSPIVFFDEATPSFCDGLAAVVSAIEGAGTVCTKIAASKRVARYVRDRHGFECSALDAVVGKSLGGIGLFLRAWTAGLSTVSDLESAHGRRLWGRAGRLQLAGESALAYALHERATVAHGLASAPLFVAASEYFAESVALREAARRHSTPWVTVQHGAVTRMFAPFTADEYWVISEQAAEALAALQPYSADAIKVVGGSDQRMGNASDESVRALREACGIEGWPGAVVCAFSQTHGPEFSLSTHFAFAAQLHRFLVAVPSAWVLIKRHPSESRSLYEGLAEVSDRVSVVPRDFDVASVAAVSDLAVAMGSTALVDALQVGCTTVEVISDEMLTVQSVSDMRVSLSATAGRLAALASDDALRGEIAQRQQAARERLLGPDDFDSRVLSGVGRLCGFKSND